MTVKNYSELIAWQRAMDLAELAFRTTDSFPLQERYGLARQVRDAAVSVPSNIAEGQGRRSTKEFLHHLSIAHGSVRELETQAILARRLGFVEATSAAHFLDLAGEVGRLLNGLYNSLRP